ncbi:MAG: hypothetical protein G01um101431_35 [Parcubacteria group bacterium Gr01-1014_31]|nr:MAG: hypothetical protein G01um101431_35 [Parcubacteria group bacterium Gr01-1014_31]
METSKRPSAESSPPKGLPPRVEAPNERRPPVRHGCHCSCGGIIDEGSICNLCRYDFCLGAFFD